jgi:hypothetical protein
MIAPLLLLPFWKTVFLIANHQTQEKTWISLDIKIEDNELFMKLVNGKSADQRRQLRPTKMDWAIYINDYRHCTRIKMN